jgi:hypothetical protein
MIPPPKKIINVCMQKFSKKLATKNPPGHGKFSK